MRKRKSLTLDEMYETILVYFQDEVENERMREAQLLLWQIGTREGECFKFTHPYHDPEISKQVRIKAFRKRIPVSRILIAEAINEDLWWVCKETENIRIELARPHCNTPYCMNPLHWCDTTLITK